MGVKKIGMPSLRMRSPRPILEHHLRSSTAITLNRILNNQRVTRPMPHDISNTFLSTLTTNYNRLNPPITDTKMTTT
jgi:hypothetical protein